MLRRSAARICCAPLSAELLACPFCRQLFPEGEAKACPECGIALAPLAKLPPSHDALAEEPPEVIPPDMVQLPWTYAGRARALLAGLGLVGLATFFAPWVHETAPELVTYSGFDIGLRLRWMFAAAIGYLVLVPLVVSRRSIRAMRGARFAVAVLAAAVLVTVAVRLAVVPTGTPTRPVRFEWGWGVYACGAVALAVLAAAARFGWQPAEPHAPSKAPPPAP